MLNKQYWLYHWPFIVEQLTQLSDKPFQWSITLLPKTNFLKFNLLHLWNNFLLCPLLLPSSNSKNLSESIEYLPCIILNVSTKSLLNLRVFKRIKPRRLTLSSYLSSPVPLHWKVRGLQALQEPQKPILLAALDNDDCWQPRCQHEIKQSCLYL